MTEKTDPHLWLEEVEGDEALAWVRSQNERTLSDLQSDERYAGFESAALEVPTSKERIPYGTIRDGQVYNFWQDDDHVRGLWRTTTLASYSTDKPDWELLLDVDALAESEDKNWVFKGANVYKPKGTDRYLCLVSLSDGGKDAIIQREFDLDARSFAPDGFVTIEAKQAASWIDADTVLIATDWGPDAAGLSTVTDSGYPFVVKRWTRGTPLAEAVEVKRGVSTDVGVWPFTIEDDSGNLLVGAVQADTFFTSTYWLLTDGGPIQWPIPPKSTPNGIAHGHFIFPSNKTGDPPTQRSFPGT